ncbi:MAG: putative lipopolysaccharide heptosyltransferase III [Verrucomicrobiales bacterium]|nr:putative lipopolysaccharide heptosyltransferase III [Verrucomicrobiales bacterium]
MDAYVHTDLRRGPLEKDFLGGPNAPNQSMKILLAKLNHLGDTLLMTPTIRFLREKYPDARIDVLVRAGCEAMLSGNPDVSNVIPVARPEKAKRTLAAGLSEFTNTFAKLFLRRYDYAFDLSDSDRSKLWMLLSAAKVRGVNDAYETLGNKRWMVNRISKFKWGREHQVLKDFQTVLDCTGLTGEVGPLRFYPQVDAGSISKKLPFVSDIGNYTIVHPTSRWPFKQWLPERWAEIADTIRRNHKLKVVFSCGPDQREIDTVAEIFQHTKEEHFSTDGRINLNEFGWLLARAKLFLGVDTVAMHLAAAMQTPIVTLFGPSQEWSWRPWQAPNEIVFGDCPCKVAMVFKCDKTKVYPCMERITVNDVVAATGRMLRLATADSKH